MNNLSRLIYIYIYICRRDFWWNSYWYLRLLGVFEFKDLRWLNTYLDMVRGSVPICLKDFWLLLKSINVSLPIYRPPIMSRALWLYTHKIIYHHRKIFNIYVNIQTQGVWQFNNCMLFSWENLKAKWINKHLYIYIYIYI